MNRLALALILAAFTVAVGACTSRDSTTQAPSSTAYLGQEEERPVGAWDRQNGSPREVGRGDGWKGGGSATNRGVREVLVQAERERPARPLVPAFPVGMRQRVLQDMGTVFFDYDAASLSGATTGQLDVNIAWMRANPNIVVRLIGHADERGTSEYNLALGMRRAERVREYLINKGIANNRLLTVSYGEELPLRRGHAESAWARNRRVEFGLGAETAQR